MGSLLLTVLPLVLFAQTPVLVESFSASAFPPPGWDTTRSDTVMNYWIRFATSGANPDSHHARVQTHKAADTLRQGFSELLTPEFDLCSAAGEESLTFWIRFSANSQNLGPDDTVSVAIREDSTDWCPLWKLGSAGQSNVWSVTRLSLASYDGFCAAQLRFRFDDRPNGGLASTNRYFWLDSVKIVSYAIGIVDQPVVPLAGRGGHLVFYPNPARSKVYVGLTRDDGRRKNEEIALMIYDITGRLVIDFSSRVLRPSSFVPLDLRDQAGRRLPAGVYFCETVVNGVKKKQSLVLIR
jgi:hypothetical protein